MRFIKHCLFGISLLSRFSLARFGWAPSMVRRQNGIVFGAMTNPCLKRSTLWVGICPGNACGRCLAMAWSGSTSTSVGLLVGLGFLSGSNRASALAALLLLYVCCCQVGVPLNIFGLTTSKGLHRCLCRPGFKGDHNTFEGHVKFNPVVRKQTSQSLHI